MEYYGKDKKGRVFLCPKIKGENAYAEDDKTLA